MAAESPRLARNPAAHLLISSRHVRGALHSDKGPAAVLESFEVADFTATGDNYACFVTSVVVHYLCRDERCSVSYVVKLNSCRSFKSSQAGTPLLFAKEAAFYERVLPNVNGVLKSLGLATFRVPTFYYSSLEKGKEIMFFEDMRAKKFVMRNRRIGMDRAHASLVFKELARLHSSAKLLLQSSGKDITSKFNLDEDFYLTMETNADWHSWFEQIPLNGAAMLETCQGYEKAIEGLQTMSSNYFSLIKEQLKPVEPFATICHGDVWNNNMLFRYDGNTPVEVCLLDLQINRHSSVATDLRYFLCTSFDGDFRRDNNADFLSEYYNEFQNCMTAANAKVPFSLAELTSEYRAKATFGLLMGLMCLPGVLSEPTEGVDYDGYSDPDMSQLLEDARLQLVRMMETNPQVRPRLLSLIDEMVEEGVLQGD